MLNPLINKGGIILIRFSCDLIDRGWTRAVIDNGESKINICASYLSDGLRDFLNSITSLIKGSEEHSCVWQEEPGENRWFFKRTDSILNIEIYYYEKNFSQIDKRNGKLTFEGTEDLLKFARQVLSVFSTLLSKYGEDEYKRLWNYDFPFALIDQLRIEVEKYHGKNK